MTDRRHCFPPFVCTVVHLCICKLEHDILKKMNEMIVLQIGTSHPQGRGLLIHYCTGSNISSICGCSSAEAVLHCVSLRPELFVVSGFSLTVYLQLGLWLLSLCVMQRQCGLDMCGLTKACIGSAVASHCHPWHDHRPTNFKRHHCWQIMKDTIHQTLFPMWYINLKTCATNNPNRKILTSDLELNPGYICYCCQVVHIKSNFSLPSFILV